jgi:excisionase family DNA binding protein
MSDDLLSVSEAAKQLGVDPSRVHHRIREGSLPARKIGNRWAIDSHDVLRVNHHAGPGRPLSAKSAWALLAVAANSQAVDELRPPDRSKARARLRELLADASSRAELDVAAAQVERALGNRAERRLFIASPRDLPDVLNDDRVHPSGVSLPESNMSAGSVAEGYVSAEYLDALVDDYLLSPASRDRANVVLHVVGASNQCRSAELGDVARSWLAIAADLAEYDGVREKGEAMRLMADAQDHVNVHGAGAVRG